MERIKTYVEGLDELLEGGIPVGSVIMISGTTGTMKSSFAWSILYQNAKKDKKGVYVALQQSEKSLAAQMENFGMPLEEVKANLYILDRYKIQEYLERVYKRTFMDLLLDNLRLLKGRMKFELLALDCLSALEIISELKKPRSDMFKFFEWLKKLSTTSFLISEMLPDSAAYGRYDEDYLVDGIIHLKMEQITDVRIQRRLRCVKLRYSPHSSDWYALLFSDKKFRVTPAIAEPE